MEKKPYYITTAIPYASSKPHVGNSYDLLLTDAVARFRRMQGYDVCFQTGADEHGQKIEDKAREEGITPQEYVDGIVAGIQSDYKELNISYDSFLRTTDPKHERVIQKIFKKLYEQDDIYKGAYEGSYCVPCESFFTDSQLKDGKCPDCGREVSFAREEAYFLRLSKYQKPLEEYIESHPDFIYPESRKKEMLNNFIKPGLQDLCVSRSSFTWGIPVDFDPGHVVYVWIDALSNYITGIGYDPDGSTDDFKKYWPGTHIIGKDIVRFHTIYWPVVLMGLGLPMPKQVYGHPWLLFGTDKMSKSKGNVIYATDLIKIFGTDAVRYYCLATMPFAQDGSITYEAVIERYNSDLANTLGNLINRTVAMVKKYFDGALPCNTASEPLDDEFKATVLDALPAMEKAIDEFRMADAVNAVLDSAKRCNKYIDETAPWALAKDETKRDRLSTVLYNLLEGIRILAVEFSPFMPDTADTILRQINTDIRSYESIQTFGAYPLCNTVGEATPIFQRIDADAFFAEVEAKHKQAQEEAARKAEIEGVAKIGIEDFAKVDLRVAEIIACEPVKKAKKLLKLTLNDGVGERTVASGIAKWYKPEELTGKKVILVSNLKPAVLCGVESQGMILAADCAEDDVKVIFVNDMPAGAKIR